MICDRGHKISVTAGTAMHRTKLALHLWFYAAWLPATLKPGISAVQLQRQLDISRLETAWTLLHKLRAAMYAPGRERLSSFCLKDYHADHWVEVDEVYVGGEEEGTEHRGRGAETKSLVVVAVEVHKWQGDAEEQDGTKIHANASRHSALSYGHAEAIEAQLKAEVQQLLALAEEADGVNVPDGMSVPEELKRREDRLAAIADAKAKIEARAAERFAREQAD